MWRVIDVGRTWVTEPALLPSITVRSYWSTAAASSVSVHDVRPSPGYPPFVTPTRPVHVISRLSVNVAGMHSHPRKFRDLRAATGNAGTVCRSICPDQWRFRQRDSGVEGRFRPSKTWRVGGGGERRKLSRSLKQLLQGETQAAITLLATSRRRCKFSWGRAQPF